jgi:hypothetical protein
LPKSALRWWELDSSDKVIAWLAEKKTLPVWRLDGQIDFSPHLHASAANRFVKMLGLTSRESVKVARGAIRSSPRWGVSGTKKGNQRGTEVTGGINSQDG